MSPPPPSHLPADVKQMFSTPISSDLLFYKLTQTLKLYIVSNPVSVCTSQASTTFNAVYTILAMSAIKNNSQQHSRLVVTSLC